MMARGGALKTVRRKTKRVRLRLKPKSRVAKYDTWLERYMLHACELRKASKYLCTVSMC